MNLPCRVMAKRESWVDGLSGYTRERSEIGSCGLIGGCDLLNEAADGS